MSRVALALHIIREHFGVAVECVFNKLAEHGRMSARALQHALPTQHFDRNTTFHILAILLQQNLLIAQRVRRTILYVGDPRVLLCVCVGACILSVWLHCSLARSLARAFSARCRGGGGSGGVGVGRLAFTSPPAPPRARTPPFTRCSSAFNTHVRVSLARSLVLFQVLGRR